MYKFNKETLEFVKVYWPAHLWKYLTAVIIIIGMWAVIVPFDRKLLIRDEVKIIIAQRNEFSEEKLISLIKSLNFPFSYIVMAQAIHETHSFKSILFIENKNLFGMKQSYVRIHISKGTNNEYAIYDTWMDSVYDRAFYSATYLSNIKTEDEYYSYLSQMYAEDKDYVNKLKKLIFDKQLKSKF